MFSVSMPTYHGEEVHSPGYRNGVWQLHPTPSVSPDPSSLGRLETNKPQAISNHPTYVL